MLGLAREVDTGSDVGIFVEMIGFLRRYSDVELALGEVDIAELRSFFAEWVTEFKSGG